MRPSLFVSEDNEAVIKTVMEGRVSNMRHVSRTHRVVLGWLFDRVNLEEANELKNVNTSQQIADA